jgi:4-hydroxy-tetrahydrodipicolinate reductase
MGRRLVALGARDAETAVAAALELPDHPDLGKDAGMVAGLEPLGVALSADLGVAVDVVIDFSVPASAESITATCVQRRIPLVMATTGLSDEQKDQITRAAKSIPIVWAPNMSLAVNLTMKLAATAAEALTDYPSGADVEIIERHHRYKEDAPSGTALKFGEIIARHMGQSNHIHGRCGRPGQRPRDEIGYHALRVGDDPGQHTIAFGLLGETLELTVRATNRDCYAQGALAAAKFLIGKPPQIYTMFDVLGL